MAPLGLISDSATLLPFFPLAFGISILHQPEPYQLSLKLQLKTPIDRIPGTHGSDKNPRYAVH